jgi:hypothetical protein
MRGTDRANKWKTIFLGQVDMAIENDFIVNREDQKKSGVPRADHVKFLQVLHAQMIELTAADFANQVRPSAGIGG